MAETTVVLMLTLYVLYVTAQTEKIESALPHNIGAFKALPKDPKIYEELCRLCTSSDRTIGIPMACHLYLQCTDFGSYIMQCGVGLALDEETNSCDYPKRTSCGGQNLCLSGKRFTDGVSCDKYYSCNPETKALELTSCGPGESFDATKAACTNAVQCTPTVRALIDYRCRSVGEGDTTYIYEESRLSQTTGERIETTETRTCPPNWVYVGECHCIPSIGNGPGRQCQIVKLIDLSSNSDAWNTDKARGRIRGNATIEANGAFFNGDNVFEVPSMIKNEPGSYWSLSFKFRSMKWSGDSMVPGAKYNGGVKPVALVDNSACGIQPTYGCQLIVQAEDRGQVRCYAHAMKGPKNNPISTAYSKTVSVDLTGEVSVTFSRYNAEGQMVVSPSNDGTRTWSYDYEDVIGSTQCPGTIGAGTDQDSFLGYIDDVVLQKECPFVG